jgi:hypothetical protein
MYRQLENCQSEIDQEYLRYTNQGKNQKSNHNSYMRARTHIHTYISTNT